MKKPIRYARNNIYLKFEAQGYHDAQHELMIKAANAPQLAKGSTSQKDFDYKEKCIMPPFICKMLKQ